MKAITDSDGRSIEVDVQPGGVWLWVKRPGVFIVPMLTPAAARRLANALLKAADAAKPRRAK